MMVAPLTTALMSSVPGRYAGVASAVNNAISRVGPQLAGAVIFIAITSSFYAGLEARVPDLDTSSPPIRQRLSPLNAPRANIQDGREIAVSEEVVRAVREQSTDAFHLAMLVGAALLLAGAAVNAVGIRNAEAHRIT